MRNKLLILLVSMLLPFMSIHAKKKEASTAADSAALIIEKAIERATPWTTAEISGKLRLPKLPISPSIKIYMKKGSDIILSARAPFLGEVVRVELAGDSLLAVNKMKKLYARLSTEGIREIDPSICEEVQALLLGRVAIPGYGEISHDNCMLGIREMAGEELLFSPTSDTEEEMADAVSALRLIYRMASEGALSQVVLVKDGVRALCMINVEEDKKGKRDIDVVVNSARPLELTLELDAPQWDVTIPASGKVDFRYREISFKEFMKSF